MNFTNIMFQIHSFLTKLNLYIIRLKLFCYIIFLLVEQLNNYEVQYKTIKQFKFHEKHAVIKEDIMKMFKELVYAVLDK